MIQFSGGAGFSSQLKQPGNTGLLLRETGK